MAETYVTTNLPHLQGCLANFPGCFWLGCWFSFFLCGEIVDKSLPKQTTDDNSNN